MTTEAKDIKTLEKAREVAKRRQSFAPTAWDEIERLLTKAIENLRNVPK